MKPAQSILQGALSGKLNFIAFQVNRSGIKGGRRDAAKTHDRWRQRRGEAEARNSQKSITVFIQTCCQSNNVIMTLHRVKKFVAGVEMMRVARNPCALKRNVVFLGGNVSGKGWLYFSITSALEISAVTSKPQKLHCRIVRLLVKNSLTFPTRCYQENVNNFTNPKTHTHTNYHDDWSGGVGRWREIIVAADVNGRSRVVHRFRTLGFKDCYDPAWNKKVSYKHEERSAFNSPPLWQVSGVCESAGAQTPPRQEQRSELWGMLL